MNLSESPPTQAGHLISIQVGLPRTHGSSEAAERPWTTGFYKSPVSGPVFVGSTNIEGDGQADLRVHGGIDKAVLAYSAKHYAAWRTELNRPDLPLGAFGENLTIAELAESDVCIGDIWQVGDVLLEVAQPRQPCWKLARRWKIKTLPKLVVQTGRSGWYLRVLREGTIQNGFAVHVTKRRHPKWTIALANRAMYGEVERVEKVALMALPELSAGWRSDLS